MKVLVAVKRVVDYTVKIRVKTDGSGVETTTVKHSMNPFDEIAVEEALRLKEAGSIKEVCVVTVGPQSSQETLRHALALGADTAIHIETPEAPEPLSVAKLLKKVVEKESPQLVILGKQAIDDDCNQVGQMLAALLNWPQGTFISKLTLASGKAEVIREVDGGLETISFPLPAIVTTDLRLNTPRYASLPNIMKARQKPLTQLSAAELGVEISPRLKTLRVSEPHSRKAGVRVDSVEELMTHIQKVI